jgi:hypothetical protein
VESYDNQIKTKNERLAQKLNVCILDKCLIDALIKPIQTKSPRIIVKKSKDEKSCQKVFTIRKIFCYPPNRPKEKIEFTPILKDSKILQPTTEKKVSIKYRVPTTPDCCSMQISPRKSKLISPRK